MVLSVGAWMERAGIKQLHATKIVAASARCSKAAGRFMPENGAKRRRRHMYIRQNSVVITGLTVKGLVLTGSAMQPIAFGSGCRHGISVVVSQNVDSSAAIRLGFARCLALVAWRYCRHRHRPSSKAANGLLRGFFIGPGLGWTKIQTNQPLTAHR